MPKGSNAQRRDGFPGQRRPQGYPRKLEESRVDSNLKKPKLLQFYKEVFSTVKGSIHLLDVQLGRLFTAQRHLQRKIMVAKIQLVLCSLSCMP